MNIITFNIVVDKVLGKLFGRENIHKIHFHPNGKHKGKIFFNVTLKDKKFRGYIFYGAELSGKDIRNILFAYKRNLLTAMKRGAGNANVTTKEICPRMDKQEGREESSDNSRGPG